MPVPRRVLFGRVAKTSAAASAGKGRAVQAPGATALAPVESARNHSQLRIGFGVLPDTFEVVEQATLQPRRRAVRLAFVT